MEAYEDWMVKPPIATMQEKCSKVRPRVKQILLD